MRHPDPSTFALYLLALDALGLKATAAKLAESNDADQLVLAVVTIRAAVATAAPSGPRSTEIMRKILVVLEALAADLLHLSPPCYCAEGEACEVGRRREALAPYSYRTPHLSPVLDD